MHLGNPELWEAGSSADKFASAHGVKYADPQDRVSCMPSSLGDIVLFQLLFIPDNYLNTNSRREKCPLCWTYCRRFVICLLRFRRDRGN